ncbi:MAG TPA: ABC transporter ATP-binding protein [Verrucomicrobiales bacterium]|nr:ABC transporter ATP-binding protein [Verrucomicrobiales bacterium]HIL69112.1 ABC transporter ATP-binding protein [Verrucomicrobiota bacterium]
MLHLNGIRKTYQDGILKVHALKDINLEAERGELISIMGPSGSGKSTLLHILGCLDHPTQGQYYFDGENTATFDDRQLTLTRNKRIGFVFQSFNLLHRETALENVSLPLMYAGESGIQSKAQEALEKVGLGARLNHRPGQLSGGEQQRVAIARAMVKKPDVILADEPTGNLDSQVGKNIMRVFQQMHEEGMTIILITHNPEVAQLGTRLLKLHDGQLEE